MIIGSIKENDFAENRVSLVPDVVRKFIEIGFEVVLEEGYGERLGLSDEMYQEAGAKLDTSFLRILDKADIVIQILPLAKKYLEKMNDKQVIIADFSGVSDDDLTGGATYVRLERVPRTTIAQSIDILSTQSTVRGYAAGIYALNYSKELAQQMMTAAFSTKALQAVVIGASVCSLQVASVLKRQGCKVVIGDINEQAQELAKSVGVDFKLIHQSQEWNELISNKHFLIAAVGHKNAPRIIEKKQLCSLGFGAVVLDLTDNNIGVEDNYTRFKNLYFHRDIYMERRVPLSASLFFSYNVFNLISLIKTSDDVLNFNYNYVMPMIYYAQKKITSHYADMPPFINKNKGFDMIFPF